MVPLYGGGYWAAFFQISLVYYGAAFLLHTVAPRLFPVKGIQPGQRQQLQVVREIFNSLGAIAVKALVFVGVERLQAVGWTKLYTGSLSSVDQVAYALCTIVALDYLHDAWFYWTHRALHWRPLYKHVHYMHHRSRTPTAFTGYSFHVAEAALVFANEVIVCFLFPIHMGLHRLYHLFTTVIHNGGHAGYEIAPFIPSLEQLAWTLWQGMSSPARGLNTVQHHDMHHRYPTRHFSLYFTHWDRWCGTQHPHYETGLFSYFAPPCKSACKVS